MKYGYARVSSSGQDLTIQVEALTNAHAVGENGISTIRHSSFLDLVMSLSTTPTRDI